MILAVALGAHVNLIIEKLGLVITIMVDVNIRIQIQKGVHIRAVHQEALREALREAHQVVRQVAHQEEVQVVAQHQQKYFVQIVVHVLKLAIVEMVNVT